jgi:protease I
VLSLHDGEIEARQMDTISAGTIPVDGLVSDASVDDYDALLLPGGTVNPDKLRMDGDAVAFVKAFVESGKPVAAICHGPWTLAEADVVRGPPADLVAERPHRPAQRGRGRRGPGGRRRRVVDDEPLAR